MKRRIGDRFVIEATLGAGGMSDLHRGVDERLGRPVAIKLLKPALADDPILRERFRREARALSTLRHPNIVGVLDFGEADGELYTVLELVEGLTLESLVPLATERAASIIDQVLAALETCHARGVVHRDIKPTNVMVSKLDHITLIDFGLAHTNTSPDQKLTDTGVVQGTPPYMAPEQCRGEEVGPETDVYSTGIVFYELLAGRGPFDGKDAATFMAQHLFVEPRPLDDLTPVARGVAEAIAGALAKRREDRPSASELRAALRSAFAGTDPAARALGAAAERHRIGGLDRESRALGSNPRSQPTSITARVLVWIDDSERCSRIRSCLGAAGHTTFVVTGDPLPDLTNANAVIVSARDGISRVECLREATKLPVIVIDIASPSETTTAIRAGADEMLLREAADGELAPKLQRLLRRKR